MLDGSAAGLAAQSFLSSEQGAAAQPTAAQAARFETQLQDGVAQYAPPSIQASERGAFQPMLDYISKVGENLRIGMREADVMPKKTPIDPDTPADLRAVQEMLDRGQMDSFAWSQKLQKMKNTEVEFIVVSKQIELLMRNVQTLYQQQG